MAQMIHPAGPNLEIWKMQPEELREQSVNAQVMAPEMLERLAATIRHDQRLESLPLAVRRKDYFEVVSGHHRLRAARMAGLKEVYVLVDTRNLDRSQVVAKQIAHNRINGSSDQETLKRMFSEIERVEDILESYVTAADFGDIATADSISLPPLTAVVPWYLVSFAFLPAAIENFELLESKLKEIKSDTDLVGVASADIYERFAQAVAAVTKTENVRSVGTVISRMIDITLAHFATAEMEHARTQAEADPPETHNRKPRQTAVQSERGAGHARAAGPAAASERRSA